MWPMLLDMTEEESVQSLRHLELEAYSSLISALRAQGTLNSDKRRILKETSMLLNISGDRHKAEIRRAISDEKLNTIAYHITGRTNSLEDWAHEGRRLVPLLPRTPPQTPYSEMADEASDTAVQHNKQLPFPANTERKRPIPQTIPSATVALAETVSKPATFRIPDVPKDEPKRRKCHSVGESSTLAQHLLAPKISKIQQIYRQASARNQKNKLKESIPEVENIDLTHSPSATIPQTQLLPPPPSPSQSKINIIQNISIPFIREEPPFRMIVPEAIVIPPPPPSPAQISENILAPVSKPINVKPNYVIAGNHTVTNEVPEQTIDPAKLCITKKTINKGHKLIVVPNSQSMPTNSILQKTLSVPMNKLAKLNLEKFKIVPNNQIPAFHVARTPTAAAKPKLLTIKGASGNKVIPLSQLQMLNTKRSLKMIPYTGQINSFPTTPPDNPLRSAVSINNSFVDLTDDQSKAPTEPVVVEKPWSESIEKVRIEPIERVQVEEINGVSENGVLCFNNFESRVGEFVAEANCDLDSSETLSSTESEADEKNSNGDLISEMEIENYQFLETHQENEVLEEFEVIHTEELL